MEDQHSNFSPVSPRHPDEWQAGLHQSRPIVIQQGTAIGAEGHMLAWTRYASLDVGIRCEPPLVLVHGAAHQGAIFDTWAREIAHYGVIVYALDMRGHGRSSMPPGQQVRDTHLRDYVADVRLLTETIGVANGQFVLLGHSLGGAVVQLYARQYPVAGLILLASVSAHRLFSAWGRLAARNLPRALRAMMVGAQALFASPAQVRRLLVEPDADAATVDLVLSQLGKETAAILGETVDLLRCGLQPVHTQHVWFLGGERDACFSPDLVHASARDYHTTAIMLPRAPHDLMVARPLLRMQAAQYVVRWCFVCARGFRRR